MSEVTKEHIAEMKEKMEQAKVLFLKYSGALEVLESIVNIPTKDKKVAKTKK